MSVADVERIKKRRIRDAPGERKAHPYASAIGRAIGRWLGGVGSGREASHTEPLRLASASYELRVPSGMCALSEQRHKEQLAFARQLNPRQKLLLLMVPCDRLALYEPNSSADTNASLLFDTAEWSALFDGEREILKASNSTISSIKSGLQDSLQALNAARASGQRYPATGPELRNVTIVNERRDRIFLTSINRFQRPFDRGPVDRYGASGFVVTAPYVFKFSVFSYVRNENDLLAIAETAVDALSLGGQH